MNKSKIFFILSLAFIGGVGTASFYYPKIISQVLLLILAILALIFIAVFYRNKTINVAGFGILFFVFGVYLMNGQLAKLKNLSLDQKIFSGQAMVYNEPQVKEKMQTLIVRDENKNKFLLNASVYETYNYGDNLDVNCILSVISNVGLDFDYQLYLAKDGIYYECKKPKIKKLETNSASYFYANLLNFKNKFNANISKIIPNPEAGLLSGLLLGGNDKLSKEMQEKFSATGMTHIVAVSGYNVTIIA